MLYILWKVIYIYYASQLNRDAELSLDDVASCLCKAHFFGRQLIYMIKSICSLSCRFIAGDGDF